MKILRFFVLCFLLMPVSSFAKNSYKFSYFPFKQISKRKNYNFLSMSIPRSIRSVVSSDRYLTTPTDSKQIKDAGNREQVLQIGKHLNSDIIICGTYKINGQSINAKIILEIYIYDIQGSELVIRKRVIGGTGIAMFTMIDETAVIVKNSVENYYKNRQKILEQSRKRREKLLEIKDEAEKEQFVKKMQQETIRTRYNDSKYLDSHVAKTKNLKIFTYLMQDYFEYSIIDSTYTGSAKNTLFSVSLSIGLGKNLELRLDLSSILYHIEDHSVTFSDSAKTIFFNPALNLKWRALQNENHNINLTLLFGVQPAVSDTSFGGTIFHPFTFSSLHTFYFGIYLDKTLGKFTPFISVDFTLERRYKGKYVYNLSSQQDLQIKSMSSDFHFTMISKLGFEYWFTSWFIVQASFIFSFSSKMETVVISEHNPSWLRKLGNYYQYSPGIKLIFKLSKSSALSFSYVHIFSNNLETDSGFVELSPFFKVFVYFATSLSL